MCEGSLSAAAAPARPPSHQRGVGEVSPPDGAPEPDRPHLPRSALSILPDAGCSSGGVAHRGVPRALAGRTCTCGTLEGLPFLLRHPQPNTPATSYGDGASYRILDDGIVEIVDTAKGKRYLVASAAWLWIEEAWRETDSTGLGSI